MKLFVMFLLVLLLGAGGTLLTLVLTGVIELGDEETQPATAQLREGMVAVPAAVRPIRAHERVTREHLIDPETMTINTVTLPVEEVEDDYILNIGNILNRVMARDKRRDYIFRERDFLPEGTRPGLVAGIPEGMRSIVIRADSISGIHGLNAGDRIDLVASAPLEMDRPNRQQPDIQIPGSMIPMQTGQFPLRRMAETRVIAQNGIVVQPVRVREVPVEARTGLTGSGVQHRSRPVEEITIAVHAHEVGAVMEALELGHRIACLARSGRPSEQDDDVITIPERQQNDEAATPMARFPVVETIVGSRRETHVVPSTSAGTSN